MILSSNIHQNLPTTIFWDNIDRIEETLRGAGTSQRVNGIAIEPQLIGPQKDLTSKTNIAKSKNRSITSDELPLPFYNAGERVGPPPIPLMGIEMSTENAKSKVNPLTAGVAYMRVFIFY